jgi:ribokinase
MTQKQNLTPQIAVLGAAAMDWVARVKNMPPRDGIVHADQYTPMPGGTGGNVAVGLARLGHGVRFLGVLGGDESGKILMDDFIQSGVDTSAITIDKDQRSAACFIAIDENGERLIFGLGGVALYDHPEQIKQNWFRDIQVLFIADAYDHVAAAAMKYLKPDARVVFNPGGLMASAGAEYLKPFFHRADILIVSRGESEIMTGINIPEEAARELSRRGPLIVMVTLGSQGALVLEKGEISFVEGYSIPIIVDTTGAGDAFSSGVIAGYLEGLSWVDAARLGCATAAIKIGYLGARGGLPGRQQVQDLLIKRDVNSCIQR